MHPDAEKLDQASPEELAALLLDAELRGVRIVRRQAAVLGRAATVVADALRGGGRLIYAGAGTSGRLGALDGAELPPTFGCDPAQVVVLVAGGRRALWRSVEGAEDRGEEAVRRLRRLRPGPADVLIVIAASGVTPFSLAALQEARCAGARTIFITCAETPAHRERCDVLVSLPVGPEVLSGSTRLKAGTATKLALNAISTGAMVQLGKVFRGRMVDLQVTNQKLRHRAGRIVAELCHVEAAAADRLLRRAKGQVKLAVTMGLLGVGKGAAERALRRAGGDLRLLSPRL